VTATGNAVAVAWFTIAGGTPHVKVSFSTDGGRRFGVPVQVDTNTTFGRLGMVMPSADRVIVSSMERGPNGVELLVRDVHRDRGAGAPVVIAPTSSERSSGFARLALSGPRLIVAWTETARGAAPRVKVASATLR
jgi:hypothetical protein